MSDAKSGPLELPPVLSILLSEGEETTGSVDKLSRLLKRGLFKELHEQAQGTKEGIVTGGNVAPTSGFAGFPAGTLDPLSGTGKCDELLCRQENARAFARTVGILCDSISLPDLFTPLIEDASSIDELAPRLFRELKVYKELHPLVEAGIIRLAHRRNNLCVDCIHKGAPNLARSITDLTDQAIDEGRFSVASRTSDEIVVEFSTPIVHGDPRVNSSIVLRGAECRLLAGGRVLRNGTLPKQSALRLRKKVLSYIEDEVFLMLGEMELASSTNSVLIAGSARDTSVLRAIDPEMPRANEVENWEMMRTIKLPWISGLRPEDVVRLRESADKALPRLRAQLASKLIANVSEDSKVEGLAAELKEQALEVEAEIIAIQKRWPGIAIGSGIASMGLVLCAFAQSPALAFPAIASVLAAVAMSHVEHAKRNSDISRQKSRPGYAVLRAKELLDHQRH